MMSCWACPYLHYRFRNDACLYDERLHACSSTGVRNHRVLTRIVVCTSWVRSSSME